LRHAELLKKRIAHTYLRSALADICRDDLCFEMELELVAGKDSRLRYPSVY